MNNNISMQAEASGASLAGCAVQTPRVLGPSANGAPAAGTVGKATAVDLRTLKARQKATWESGDFGQVAKFTLPCAEEFMARLDLRPAMHVRDRFHGVVEDLRLARRMARLRFSFDPAGTVEFFRCCYGPTQRAFQTLDSAGQAALRNDLVEFEARHNVSPRAGETETPSEYLQVHARRSRAD